jgi:hypothetical protein
MNDPLIDPALIDQNVKTAFAGTNRAFPHLGIQDNEGWHYNRLSPMRFVACMAKPKRVAAALIISGLESLRIQQRDQF